MCVNSGPCNQFRQCAVLHWNIMVHQFEIMQWHICVQKYIGTEKLEAIRLMVRPCSDTVIFQSPQIKQNYRCNKSVWPQIKQNYGRNKTVGKVLLAAAQTDHYPFRAKKLLWPMLLLLLWPAAFALVGGVTIAECFFSYIIIILFPH